MTYRRNTTWPRSIGPAVTLACIRTIKKKKMKRPNLSTTQYNLPRARSKKDTLEENNFTTHCRQ